MTQSEHGEAVSSGMVTLIITNTTYDVTRPGCHETGTYTISGSNMTVTTGTATGNDCDSLPGEIDVYQFTVNSTNLTLTYDDGTLIWKKIDNGSSGTSFSSNDLVGLWGGCWSEDGGSDQCGTITVNNSNSGTVNCSNVSFISTTIDQNGTVILLITADGKSVIMHFQMTANKNTLNVTQVIVDGESLSPTGTFTKNSTVACNN